MNAISRDINTRDVVAELKSLGAEISYISGFLDAGEARRTFCALLAEIALDPAESLVRRPFSAGWWPMKRLQAARGDAGTSYRYSGTTIQAKAWTPTLLNLRSRLRIATGEDPNFVLINAYRSGRDAISWHRDDERDLVKPATILSLSLGATRDFQLSPARGAVARIFTIPLEAGSLLILRHPTNQLFEHRVPERRRVAEPRLNLTWRTMIRSDHGRSSLLSQSTTEPRTSR